MEEEKKRVTEECQAMAIYSQDAYNQGLITYIIDNRIVISIDTNSPTQIAKWGYLEDVLQFDGEEGLENITPLPRF